MFCCNLLLFFKLVVITNLLQYLLDRRGQCLSRCLQTRTTAASRVLAGTLTVEVYKLRLLTLKVRLPLHSRPCRGSLVAAAALLWWLRRHQLHL